MNDIGEKHIGTTNSDESAETLREKSDTAETIIRRHVYMAMGVGLLPLPLLDFAAITGVQLNLMRKLAKLYDVPFSKDMVKNLVGALLGGAFPVSAGPQFAWSILKMFPVIGQTIGVVSVSAFAGASTYAVGKVFNRHYFEGGTFLSFDPEKAKAYYGEMLGEGLDVVAKNKPGQSESEIRTDGKINGSDDISDLKSEMRKLSHEMSHLRDKLAIYEIAENGIRARKEPKMSGRKMRTGSGAMDKSGIFRQLIDENVKIRTSASGSRKAV